MESGKGISSGDDNNSGSPAELLQQLSHPQSAGGERHHFNIKNYMVMKKIFVSAMIGLLLLNGTTFGGEPAPVPVATPGLNFVFKVIFKRPKTDCQSGFGICLITSIYWGENQTGGAGDYVPADITLNERNQLIVKVKAESLTKYDGGSALPYFRDKSSITIPDPYPLPEETCKALKAKPPLTIKPGSYPVTFDDGIYTVIFQL